MKPSLGSDKFLWALKTFDKIEKVLCLPWREGIQHFFRNAVISANRKKSSPEFFLSANSDWFLILDEIQRVPEIFPVLRSFIDRMERKIRILVLGSASPELF